MSSINLKRSVVTLAVAAGLLAAAAGPANAGSIATSECSSSTPFAGNDTRGNNGTRSGVEPREPAVIVFFDSDGSP